MTQFYIDGVIQLALLDHIFQFTGGGRFTEILVVFGHIEGVWGGQKDLKMIYLRFSPNVTCLYDQNEQLKLEVMAPNGCKYNDEGQVMPGFLS